MASRQVTRTEDPKQHEQRVRAIGRGMADCVALMQQMGLMRTKEDKEKERVETTIRENRAFAERAVIIRHLITTFIDGNRDVEAVNETFADSLCVALEMLETLRSDYIQGSAMAELRRRIDADEW